MSRSPKIGRIPPPRLPKVKRLLTVLAAVTSVSLFALCTGCSNRNGTGSNSISHVPSVDPTTVPLPSNIPPDQQARIRQQQAAAYAEGQAAQQRAQAAQRH